MRITWYGTAALLLEAGDALLAFDPFGGIAPGCAQPESCREELRGIFRKAGHIFVTHGHFDHILQIPDICRETDAVIYATNAPSKTLIRRGVPETRLRRIRPGDAVTAGGATVRACQGRHCRFDLPLALRTLFGARARKNRRQLLLLLRLNARYKEKKEILCYEVAEGERRVLILGSLGLDRKTNYPQGADLLILPFQGKSDPARAALEIIERLRPKAVILDHFDDSFPPMTAEIPTKEFETLVRERLGIPCRAPKPGETVTVG